MKYEHTHTHTHTQTPRTHTHTYIYIHTYTHTVDALIGGWKQAMKYEQDKEKLGNIQYWREKREGEEKQNIQERKKMS